MSENLNHPSEANDDPSIEHHFKGIGDRGKFAKTLREYGYSVTICNDDSTTSTRHVSPAEVVEQNRQREFLKQQFSHDIMAPNLYDRDYYQWLDVTATLLSEGRLNDLDVPNLLDELEAMGKSQKRAIESYLKVLLLHLLKWKYQPAMRPGSWRSSIRNSRLGISDRIEESPSLRELPELILEKCYGVARSNAADETGLDRSVFPEICPFTLVELLQEDFLPEN